MTDRPDLPETAAKRLKWPLRLTFLGLFAERTVQAFWPLWTVLLVVLAGLMAGLHETLPLEAVWGLAVLAVLGGLGTLFYGVRALKWPTWADAVDRVDQSLPERPITAIADTQAIGQGDAASEAVWQAHIARMTDRLAAAKAAEPDLTLSTRDRFGLRYIALTGFVAALLFGSLLRVATVADIGATGEALATGPAWEGWVEPPLYTGKPSLYLNDIDRPSFAVAQGSRLTVRFYGELGELTLHETVSGRTAEIPPATDPVQTFEVVDTGEVRIEGPGGRTWAIEVELDAPPTVAFDGPLTQGEGGRMEAPFSAQDDYGVTGGRLEITLDLDNVDRSYGLSVAPETREPIVVDLPMTISGDRTDFSELVIEELSEHPWANLPVRAELFAVDAAEQEGSSEPQLGTLPGRRFFDPLAKAVIEQRRDLLWNRSNAPRVAQVLRAVSFTPSDIFRSETSYLKLRFMVRRLETRVSLDRLDNETVDELAEALWDLAVEIEEGDLSDALERLRRAQDRLSEAIENGATDQEIAELMQELQEAMQDYMRQLAEQSDPSQQQTAQGDMQEMSQQDLQDMLDRLQELMEQGRTEEAQQLLDQLRQMMENMQVAQGQQGGQQGEGQQAMEGLAETLREQQGLSDEAFRDLQEQFNPDAQQGQSQQNEGRSGDQGLGQQHSQGQQGQGQQGGQPGQQPGQQQGQQPGGQQQAENGEPGAAQGDLANRQQALRQELNRQMQNLPGAGTPEGDAARDSLGRAGDAMDQAEDALRNEDFAGALDNQADAIEALREGMRELAEQMAQQQQQQGGQQGEQLGQANPNGQRDPLGRDIGQNGQIGTEEQLLQGEDVYRRARELLDEIRRRSGEQDRPTEELEYLKRLLERF
ncbi:MAG: TIGR02302 family protein [Pseudomonadota bacterium]